MCRKILNRKEQIFPKSIFSSILHEKKVETAAMRMGKEKEREILIRYKQFIYETTWKDVELQCCGFLISLEKGWLGESPDAVVIESNQLQGCVEVKTAVAYWGKTRPETARTNKNFCLNLSDCGSLALKSRNGYHQCQLQLYAGNEKFNFCDIVLATERNTFVGREQIWAEEQIPKIESFCDSFLLNRLVK